MYRVHRFIKAIEFLFYVFFSCFFLFSSLTLTWNFSGTECRSKERFESQIFMKWNREHVVI